MTGRDPQPPDSRSPASAPQPAPAGNDAGDYVQLFAAVLAALAPLVSAASVRALVSFVATLAATATVCNLIIYLYRHRGRPTRRVRVQGVVIAVVMALSLFITFALQSWPGGPLSATTTPSATTRPSTTASPSTTIETPTYGATRSVPPSSGSASPSTPRPSTSPSAPRPIVDKQGYVLLKPPIIFPDDRDKVDLDTGCRGSEGTPPVGEASRCGGIADLILNENGVHTVSNRPGLISLPSGLNVDYTACYDLFSAQPYGGRPEIVAANLMPGGRLCVQTDRGNIALVRIDQVIPDPPEHLETLTISFTVWRPGR